MLHNLPEDPLKQLCILVVEDQMQVRAWIADLLRAMGVREILMASDGIEALETVRQQRDRIDIIVCDWAMPRMSGIELLREVRLMHPAMPFLMQTGHGTRDHVLEARNKGVSAFIVKPFSGAQLEVKLRQIAKSIRKAPTAGWRP